MKWRRHRWQHTTVTVSTWPLHHGYSVYVCTRCGRRRPVS